MRQVSSVAARGRDDLPDATAVLYGELGAADQVATQVVGVVVARQAGPPVRDRGCLSCAR